MRGRSGIVGDLSVSLLALATAGYAARVTERRVARQTIKEIAARAGVSTAAVSYALNDRPGVSAQTRTRIRAVAEELGWQPDSAARALASAQTDTVGLVLPAGVAGTLGVSPWYMEFISGIEQVLAPEGRALLLQVATDQRTELGIYRNWAGSRRVDAAVLVDVELDDPRVRALADGPFPVVAAGPPAHAGGLASVWTDDAAAMDEAVGYLAALGHCRIGRVGGPERLAHSQVRADAFALACAERGLESVTRSTDYSVDQATRATRSLLLGRSRPTALIFDDDLSAVAGLRVASELGLRVPDQLSLLAWDDSVLCQVTTPPLSAMSHDVQEYGVQVTRLLLEVMAGAAPTARTGAAPHLEPRGTTAPLA